jgi:peptide/nickel transport system permease protein
MFETIRLDFITAARARGLSDTTVTYGYALRNALLPVITIAGIQIGLMVGGVVLYRGGVLMAGAWVAC